MRSNKGGIKMWLIFAVAIIIVFAGLFYLRSLYKAPEKKAEIAEEEKKPGKPFAGKELTEKEQAEADKNALNNAILAGSAGECEKITYDEALKQKCLDNINYALALKSGNEKLCEQLFDPELKQACYDKIYYSAALGSFDSALCEKISDDNLKEKCSNQILVFMGRTATSKTDCDSITDKTLKQECVNNYYLSSSVKNMDKKSCEKITDAQVKDRCVSTIAQNAEVIAKAAEYAQQTPKTTQEVLASCDTQECKDEANYSLAFEEKDLSYCNKIIDSGTKQTCIKEQTENLDQYYLRMAMAKRDKTICGKIINTSLQAICNSN
jgi:hypothetical protein